VAAHPVAAPPSLLLVVVESWRADGLDPAVTPRLWRFAAGSLRFTNHRSGGNWTDAGVFSLLYGLHGAYAAAARSAHRGPVLFDRLRQLGYQVRVVASRSTRYPHFRDTVFAGLRDEEVEDDLPGEDSAARDRAAVARVRAFLARRDPARPFALVLFLDATHLPYAFAPGSARYRPYAERLHYTEMTEPMAPGPIRNRYLNALVDVDQTAGGLLEGLLADGLLERTAVVLTGDHGQELYEHGALGHSSAFTREQTAVPLVMRVPGVPPGVRGDLTRHVDVAPTLLALLGVDGPWEAVAQGRPLLEGGPGAERAVVCGFLDCAVVEADGSTTAFQPGDPLEPPRVWDGAWRPQPPAAASAALPRVRAELRDFLE
jgi:membrane-anchored protein YejM (alkaline phosphatase superfamily)